MMSKKSAPPKISIHSASQRAPLNLNVNYVTVIKYTCTYQISYKTEIFMSFNSMHFYLDLLLIKYAYHVESLSCFCFSAWSKQVCYELTVEFSCNSNIVLSVSINYKRCPEKIIGFETVDDEY